MDMLTPLRAYLDTQYAGRDAEEAAEDLAKIAAMRSDVVANAVSTSDARRDLLVRCVLRSASRVEPWAARTARGGRRAQRVCTRRVAPLWW